jgi:histone deacetylase complex regulatory component SIN3
MPFFRPEYKLMFASQNYYIFFKQIYTIYERLIKARELIGTKVDEDLSTR